MCDSFEWFLHIDRELEGTFQGAGILGGDDSSGVLHEEAEKLRVIEWLSLKKTDALVYFVDNLSDFQECWNVKT